MLAAGPANSINRVKTQSGFAWDGIRLILLGESVFHVPTSPLANCDTSASLGEIDFVGLRAVGGVGPDVARRVGRIEIVSQLRPLMGGRAGEPVFPVDRDVRLEAKHRASIAPIGDDPLVSLPTLAA